MDDENERLLKTLDNDRQFILDWTFAYKADVDIVDMEKLGPDYIGAKVHISMEIRATSLDDARKKASQLFYKKEFREFVASQVQRDASKRRGE